MEEGRASWHSAFPPFLSAMGPSGELSLRPYRTTAKQGELAAISFLSGESGTWWEADFLLMEVIRPCELVPHFCWDNGSGAEVGGAYFYPTCLQRGSVIQCPFLPLCCWQGPLAWQKRSKYDKASHYRINIPNVHSLFNRNSLVIPWTRKKTTRVRKDNQQSEQTPTPRWFRCCLRVSGYYI